jgi:hypothetical protein
MRLHQRIYISMCAPLIVAVAAGCGALRNGDSFAPSFLAGGTPSGNPLRPMRRFGYKDLIYVSYDSPDQILVYPANLLDPKPIATITNGLSSPFGTTADHLGNVYVTNPGNDSVVMFPPNQTVPTVTYTSGINAPPAQVTVDSSEDVYVSTYAQRGRVIEYKPGSAQPSRIINVPWAWGIAVDTHKTLYVTYNLAGPFGQGRVREYVAGSKSGRDLGIKLGAAGSALIDARGDLVLADPGGKYPPSPSRIDVFKAGTSKFLRNVPHPFGSVNAMAFNHARDELWIAIETDHYYDNVAIGLHYPSGVPFNQLSHDYNPEGVAVVELGK